MSIQFTKITAEGLSRFFREGSEIALKCIAWALMGGAITVAHNKSGNIWLGVCQYAVLLLLGMYIQSNVQRVGIVTFVPVEQLHTRQKSFFISIVITTILTISLAMGGIYVTSGIVKPS